MKLLLINPLIDFSSKNEVLNGFLSRQPFLPRKHPPLALLVLAALTPSGWEIAYVDESVQPVDLETPADIVAITCMTPQATRAYEIADAFRARGARVILGGVHPSVIPHDAAPHADALLIGEAESVWRKVLADAKRGRLRSRYHGPLADMKKAPLPRYDLLRHEDFLNLPTIFFPVQFSRGCPRNCSFCSVTLLSGRRHRMKGPAQIRAEIEAAQPFKRFGTVIIKLNDANPLVHRPHAMTMIRSIAQTRAPWFCLADIDIGGDPRLLDALAASGCRVVGIGFESLDPDVLCQFSPWKRDKLPSYASAIRAIQERGIVVAGNVILGVGTHTKGDLQRIRDFSLQHRLFMQYTIATPYPGTQFYKTLQKEGRLLPDIPWREYNAHNVVFRTEMDPNQIAEDLCWLYEQSQAQESSR